MIKIEVTGCLDCPFCQVEQNFDAVGWDTLLSCNLVPHVREAYISRHIVSYDSYDEKQEPIETPEWCPLTEIQITKI